MLLLSSEFVSRVTQLAKSAYTIFTSALLYEQRWIMEPQCNQKHNSESVTASPPSGDTSPPSSSHSVLLKGWTAAGSQFCKGAGDAEEEKILCCGFTAKHFNFYAWICLLGFYFDDIKDFLQVFKRSSCI